MKKKSDLWIPDDVAAQFASRPEANRVFHALPPLLQREYVQWIAEAKKRETRRRRIIKATEMVLEKR
jgi:uncharacterized protein YdeI (YjbR/CyaY-like superfamily)